MTDRAIQLANKYTINNRYNNFGPALRSVRIDGFRGINNLFVTFDYPIVAISGLNSSGKSTIGQICMGGYKKPDGSTDYKRYYIRDFFPASVADPNPFHSSSSVVFHYETEDPEKPQELTVRRANSEWSGYKRQPERYCYYAGFSLYIPKVERKDISIYQGSYLTLTKLRPIPVEVKQMVGSILNNVYDDLHFQGIKHGKRTGELGIAVQYGNQYSENNMGFGEGRVLYIADLLENSPERSLFVIEEPETALHEHAQYQLAKYLMDVCYRRNHQIILTTHSAQILSAFPSQSRLLLYRDHNGVEAYSGLSSTRARALLSLGYSRDFIVFVEDGFAKLLLTEMIRKIDKRILQAIEIIDIGDTKAIVNALRMMEKMNKNCIAVRDADIGEDVTRHIYSFPGSKPPEVEVYTNESVKKCLLVEFGISVDRLIYLNNITDHHNLTRELSIEANTLQDYLRTLAIKTYLDDIDENDYKGLVEIIQNRV